MGAPLSRPVIFVRPVVVVILAGLEPAVRRWRTGRYYAAQRFPATWPASSGNEINLAFVAHWQRTTGEKLTVNQSHGGRASRSSR